MPSQGTDPVPPCRLSRPAGQSVRFAAEEAGSACAIAWVVVAMVLDQGNVAFEDRASRAAAFARQIAMYLAHVGFGLSMAEVGKAFRRHRTTVVHACHLIEDRRDDQRFDDLLDHLEQAAIALRAAARISRQT